VRLSLDTRITPRGALLRRLYEAHELEKKDRPLIDPFSIQDAETLIAALHGDWGEAQGNYDEFRFFAGLRRRSRSPSFVTDYDAAHGVLSITKAHVHGIDKDVTKTAEDRRVVLCSRAIAVLERQLDLRKRMLRAGAIDHEHVFFTADGEAIRHLSYPYSRWQRTLRTLPIRYRKPYAARHSSVSWNLMLGRNPLWVAKQHGHSISTMLSIYTAWVEGALEVDVETIRESMNAGAQRSRVGTLTVNAPPKCPEVVPAATSVDVRQEGESASDQGARDPVIADETPPREFGSGFANRFASRPLHTASSGQIRDPLPSAGNY
jgi:integrase